MILTLAMTILLFAYAIKQGIALSAGATGAPKMMWTTAWGFLFLFQTIFGQVYISDSRITLYLMFASATFLFGYVPVELALARRVGVTRTTYSMRHMRPFMWGTTLLGMISPLYFAHQLGIHPGALLDSGAYFDAVQEANDQIRNADVEQSIVSKIFTIFPLAGAIIGGIHLGLGRPRPRMTIAECMLPIIPGLFATMVTSSRSQTIVPLLMIGGGYITGLAMQMREGRVVKPKVLGSVAGILLGLVALILFFQSIRLKDSNFSQIGHTIEHMRPWIAGYLPALTQWINHYWDGNYGYGTSTFKGITGLLGFKTDTVNGFAESMELGHGQAGNAMTFYRAAISDFGLGGAVLFTFIWGALSAWLSAAVKRGGPIATPLYAINLAAVIWAPNYWFLGYGSRIFAPVVASAYLYAFTRRTTQRLVKPKPVRPPRAGPGTGSPAMGFVS